MAEDETEADIATLQQHHQYAAKLLSQALDYEEKRFPRKALPYYHQAVTQLLKGLAISTDNMSPADKEKADSYQQRMGKHLSSVNERIDAIESPPPRNNSEPFTSSKKPVSSNRPRTRSVDRASSNTRVSASRSRSLDRPKRTKSKDKASSVSKTQEKSAILKRLKGVDAKLATLILDDILDSDPGVTMDDIVGLESAKQAMKEFVILPALRPDLFQGIRTPQKGLLLFGPPGNGKTLLAKAVAHQAKCTFFNISASSLTSKWVGEGEKLVRALFAVARELQPSIIFIDEIDSIMTARTSSEHEASRRLKTEMLIQFDGVGSSSDDRILVMAATNIPHELDSALIRRLTCRIYVPMPDPVLRKSLIERMLTKVKHSISNSELDELARLTEGYSCSDIAALTRHAAMGPIRQLGLEIEHVTEDEVRPVAFMDFRDSLQKVRHSVSKQSLKVFEQWNKEFGSA